MKGTALVLLALTASAFTQDWTVAKCRATFEDRHKQLTAHFHGMTDTIQSARITLAH
jgi:hypothetical protein